MNYLSDQNYLDWTEVSYGRYRYPLGISLSEVPKSVASSSWPLAQLFFNCRPTIFFRILLWSENGILGTECL